MSGESVDSLEKSLNDSLESPAPVEEAKAPVQAEEAIPNPLDDEILELKEQLKGYKNKESYFKELETKAPIAMQLDEYLRLNPDKLGLVQSLLSGKTVDMGNLETGSQDPISQKLAQQEQTMRQLQEQIKQRERQEAESKSASELRSQVEEYSGKYSFLKNPTHRNAVLAMYGYADSNTTLYSVVREYAKALGETQKGTVSKYLEEKKTTPAVESKGGSSGQEERNRKYKIGSEDQKTSLEDSLRAYLTMKE